MEPEDRRRWEGSLELRLYDALERRMRSAAPPTSSLTGSGAVREFEVAVAQHFGRTFAVSVSSASVALLHATDIAVRRVCMNDVDVRDVEVLLPTKDWEASAAVVRMLGARDVQYEVGDDGSIDVFALNRFCGSQTAAIVVSHVGGVVADIASVRATVDRMSSRHTPIVIEDAASALDLGTSERPVATRGHVAIVSFGPNKAIDAGEGGMLLTDDRTLYEALVQRSQHRWRSDLAGIAQASFPTLATRLHPATALLALDELALLTGPDGSS